MNKFQKSVILITLLVSPISLLAIPFIYNVALIDDYSGCTLGPTGIKLIISPKTHLWHNLTGKHIYYYWNSQHLIHTFGVSIAEETVKADNGTHIAFQRRYWNYKTKEWVPCLKWEPRSIIVGEIIWELYLPFP